jgi:hypothetical protein
MYGVRPSATRANAAVGFTFDVVANVGDDMVGPLRPDHERRLADHDHNT